MCPLVQIKVVSYSMKCEVYNDLGKYFANQAIFNFFVWVFCCKIEKLYHSYNIESVKLMKQKVKIMGVLGILATGILNSIGSAEENSAALDSIIDLSPSPEIRLKNTTLMGDWFMEQNNEDQALEYYMRGLNEFSGEKNSAYYIEALIKVAGLEEDKNIARTMLLEAKSYVENDPKTELLYADVLEALIWTYDIKNKDVQTVTNLLETAIAIRKKYPYSTDYTATLRVLAWTYESRNLLSQAEYYYNFALTNDLNYLGFGDIRTVLAMENLGVFYIDFNQFDKAKQILEQKLEKHMSMKSLDHYNIARTESLLGWVALQKGRPEEAEAYYLSGLRNVNQSLTRSMDQPHYFSLSALFDLIYFYVSQENYDKAIHYYEEAQSVVTQTDGLSLKEHIGSLGQGSIEDFASSYAWAIQAQYNSLQRLYEYMAKQKKK